MSSRKQVGGRLSWRAATRAWTLFRNRRGDRVKLLFWDDDGYAILYKRLEAGVFRFPQTAHGVASLQVKVSELSLLLWGIDATTARRQKRFSLESHRAAQAVAS